MPLISSEVQNLYFESKAKHLADLVRDDPRRSLLLRLSSSPHSGDVWGTLPIVGLGLSLPPFAFQLALRYRLGLPVFPPNHLCSKCKVSTLDVLGDHAIHCSKTPGYKMRHDGVRDVLYAMFMDAGLHVVREAPISLSSSLNVSGHSLRPADLLLPRWTEGRPACVDVTGASPMSLSGSTFVGVDALKKAVAGKMRKHEQACAVQGYSFIPFGFDTFGRLSPEAIQLLSRLKSSVRLQMQASETVIENFVYRRISFAIFRGIALQLVGRWPT